MNIRPATVGSPHRFTSHWRAHATCGGAAAVLCLALLASCSDAGRSATVDAAVPDTVPPSNVEVGQGDGTPDGGKDLTPMEDGRNDVKSTEVDGDTVGKPDVGPGGSEAGGSSIGIDAGKGTTEFISEEPSSQTGGISGGADAGVAAGMGGSSGAGGATSSSGTNATPGSAAPGGRVADVEEADIYKIDGNRLFYLNTYRGFLVFDIADPKAPKQLSRLPVFGYPIEMFVSGTTVYALLRDALYLTEINGKPQFERYNVSQLVAIDISDLANPKVIKTIDIIGQLREGVSRKIDNSIYVVSYIPQYYYSGWSYAGTTQQKEQAWVYSFDVSDPKNLRKVGELQIFEGGSAQFTDSNVSYSKYFSNVAISATSNALMVVENWYVYASSYSSSGYGCGSYDSNQRAVVSIIDVSDPNGTIRRHTKFETNGNVSDQFKMTYVYDDKAKTGTFYGIFARSVWASSGCVGTSYTQNSLESWDVTDGANPKKLDRLDFGKQNETVRATAFDVDRKVVYGITAQRVDPLYAISIADPKNLGILSAVDGLSGDMSVFRLIYNRNFLLAVGTDTSATCTGFDSTRNTQGSNIAVSIIDVRDLNKVRLVQRQCVTVQGTSWGTSSNLTWNLDQAHKMIGMFSDDQANVITVPVNYYVKSDTSDWWWYRYQSAVGIMTWDLTKYDDTKDETHQTVLQNYGTFTHPNGAVTRTILFTHPATGHRSMINLSDTHASIADIQDLSNPQQQSIIEIAPYYSEIFRFGDYLVEHVVPKASDYQSSHEFRVRKGGSTLSEPVASFTVGQVQRVVKQGSNLVLFGNILNATTGLYQSTALVYDLSTPASPKRGGQLVLPAVPFPYYYYYCGWAWWGGYWFQPTTWTTTDQGLVMLTQTWNYTSYPYTGTNALVLLDLRDPSKPMVASKNVGTFTSSDAYAGRITNVVSDPVDTSGFYVTYQDRVGQITHDNIVFNQYRHFAQHWSTGGGTLTVGDGVNLPGPLVNTWKTTDGTRMFLTRENVYTPLTASSPYYYYYYQTDTRLALLRQTTVNGKVAAELLDNKTFNGVTLSALFHEGNSLIVTGRPNSYYVTSATTSWEKTSDRLMIFDLGQSTMTPAYDQPTKAYYLRIMGTQKDRAFLNLQGDGIVVVDTAKPAAPIGVSFLRTLGYATHLESFGDDIYVASGYFGLSHMSLTDPPNLPQQ